MPQKSPLRSHGYPPAHQREKDDNVLSCKGKTDDTGLVTRKRPYDSKDENETRIASAPVIEITLMETMEWDKSESEYKYGKKDPIKISIRLVSMKVIETYKKGLQVAYLVNQCLYTLILSFCNIQGHSIAGLEVSQRAYVIKYSSE